MKKKMMYILAAVSIMSMTGCGAQMPDLSDAQEQLVIEYATQLLMKNSASSDSRLLSESKMETEEAKEAKIRERNEKLQAARDAYGEMAEGEEVDKQTSDMEQGNSENADDAALSDPVVESVSAFYGMTDVDISYTDYTLCSSYPEEPREDDFLSIEAGADKQLLVLNFAASNLTKEDVLLDMFEKEGRYYVTINGQEMMEASTTLLLDDLSMYRDTILAGESCPLVLLYEIPKDVEITSLELTVRSGEEKAMITLQ